MAQQDLKDLGFKEGTHASRSSKTDDSPQKTEWEERKQKGFVAGVKR